MAQQRRGSADVQSGAVEQRGLQRDGVRQVTGRVDVRPRAQGFRGDPAEPLPLSTRPHLP